MKRLMFLLLLLISYNLTFSQQSFSNLIDMSTWTEGYGACPGFYLNGTSSENLREYGIGPKGDNVLLWKAIPDAISNADGGWNTNYKQIMLKQTYRFVVWIKKTNSNSGKTYFGLLSNGIVKLDNNPQSNPYFWKGDLPELDKWYLLVGYVHKKNYSSQLHMGGIYDGVTGEKVLSITDYKFTDNATNLRHRAYLYYDTNTSDRQYFYAPRMEALSPFSPTLADLLRVSDDSKLIFSYDDSGNQNQRYYCADASDCDIPTPISRNAQEKMLVEEDITNENTLENKFIVYPNPTDGPIALQWEASVKDLIQKIEITGYQTPYNKDVLFKTKSLSVVIDLSRELPGMYVVKFMLKDNTEIIKKIIKE